ncbi:hypothetical protein GUITHDRAFT_103942 [Guillardia theta CCMP2712]|uniref:TOG domain-containing protein n=2 Tax=Guillardia theta TaxID=55529 RepID=L1JPX5_GUITC|nr:hypothetical protein GUITHDRAFT_103942 [Guillardia theta CCMP2712]EKX50128.1 hypothetical protein GUITHDRAFT_103942 [Guillardia theta CCMP2712]|eukprot:XP_005837108.1 hypothetical protein GUITHDRAFT_103942 [Guillardia theta CCMP2712]
MDLGALSQLMGKVSNEGRERIVETAELKSSFVDPKAISGRGLMGLVHREAEDVESLQREISFLASEEMGKRRAALGRISLLVRNDDTPLVVLDKVWKELSIELIKLMADPVERIRDMAMRCLLSFLDKVTSVSSVLPIVIPCMVYRVATSPAEESSEEIRLLLVLILGRLVALCPKVVGQYMDAIHSILHASLQDSHPAVRKEACSILVSLCSCQKESMKMVVRYEETRAGAEPRYRYGELIDSLKSTLRHKHSSVRKVAVTALGSLLLVGDKNVTLVEDLVAWQLPNVIPVWQFFSGGVWEEGKLVKPEERQPRHNFLALLASDPSAKVRENFISVLIDWMTRLNDRWDHESRLLPYLLNGLCDPCPPLRMATFEAMERLGETHENERENNERDKQELRDFLEYGHKTPSEQNATERWRSCKHEPPFTRRPRLGARMVVRNNFRRLCPTLVRELNDWQPKTRSMAAQLLYYLVLYTEYWVTNDVRAMVESFTKCCFRSLAEMEEGDPEARLLLRQILLCARTVGEFIDPSVYMPLLLPTVRGETDLDVHRRCAAVEILRAMCEGCSSSWLVPHVSTMIAALDCSSISESRDPRLSSQLVRCSQQLAESCGEKLDEESRRQMTQIVVSVQVKAWCFGQKQVTDFPASSEELDKYARDWRSVQFSCHQALRAIASTACSSISSLLSDHFSSFLETLMPGLTRLSCLHELALLEVLYRQLDEEDVSQPLLQLLLAELVRLVQLPSSSSPSSSSSSSFLLECIIFVNFVVQDPSLPFPPQLFKQLFLALLRVALWARQTTSAERGEEQEGEEQAERKKVEDERAERALLCQTALEAAYMASAGEQAEVLFEEEAMKLVGDTLCAMMEEENAKTRELACYLTQNVMIATKNQRDMLEFEEEMRKQLLLRMDDSADAVQQASFQAMESLLEKRANSGGIEGHVVETIKKKISQTLEEPQVSDDIAEICRRLMEICQ